MTVDVIPVVYCLQLLKVHLWNMIDGRNPHLDISKVSIARRLWMRGDDGRHGGWVWLTPEFQPRTGHRRHATSEDDVKPGVGENLKMAWTGQFKGLQRIKSENGLESWKVCGTSDSYNASCTIYKFTWHWWNFLNGLWVTNTTLRLSSQGWMITKSDFVHISSSSF